MFYWQDYIVISIYFLVMLAIGAVFSKSSKNTSDYFRGGGQMSWWLTGATAFMANFSAWTFVACGGRIYQSGTLIIVTVFLFQGIIGIAMALSWVVWFRRMRVITPVDAIYRRFGRASEQVYAWQSVVTQFVLSGVGLFTLAVFIAPQLNISIAACICVVGGVIAILSAVGGSWAVVASDFVQMLVVVAIVVLTAVLVLMRPDVGGISGLIENAPSYQFDWTEKTRLPVLIIFLLGSFLLCLLWMFNMAQGAGRFLYVRNDRDARRAAWFFAVGFLVGPAIWFIPVVAGSFLVPDLATDPRFESLKNPQEAAYLATAALVLPKGMLGMLACGIFAATMSMMDSGLNRNSGILVRNIYKPLIRPAATEREMLVAGKILTGIMGATMIFVGVIYSRSADFDLFEWTQHINAALIVPMTIPLALGLAIRKTPDCTAWVCICVLALFSGWMKFGEPIDYQSLSASLGWGSPLTELELLDLSTSVIVVGNVILGLMVFLVAKLFYNEERTAPDKRARLESFESDLRSPIVTTQQEDKATERPQLLSLGSLCSIYGLAIALCIALPNDRLGRLSFLAVSIFMMGIGAGLLLAYKRTRSQTRA